MSSSVRKDVSCGIWLLVAIATGSALYGQSFFGSIVGTTIDASGASVPGAAVTLTNTGTGEAKTAATDQAGNYQFLNLVPGAYKVDVEKTGFKRVTKAGIQVTVQSAVRADVTMEIGAIDQSVEISDSAIALQ